MATLDFGLKRCVLFVNKNRIHSSVSFKKYVLVTFNRNLCHLRDEIKVFGKILGKQNFAKSNIFNRLRGNR